MTVLLLQGAVLLLVVMSLAWLAQRLTDNAGWVDVAWSVGTGAAGVWFALAPLGDASPQPRQLAVAALVAAWSLRLALHIARRASAGQDDPRYAALRVEWGPAYQRRLYMFLLVQAAVAWILALSILLAARNPVPGLRLLDLAGIVVLAVAVLGEAVADQQLHNFKRDPANRGRVCDAGLWGWSRHPNYFFEFLFWCAFPLFAISGAWWWGWITLSAPALMFWTLRYASGVPPLEEHMARRYGTSFRAYQQRVGPFVPMPPRSPRTSSPRIGDQP
jgi:steroid 5-alpha reductase family enzyme